MNRTYSLLEFADAQSYQRACQFSCQDLVDISEGVGPIANFPKLPKPGMLMLDRITHIEQHAGNYGNGRVLAELDILPDHWFFECHFDNDPVMPGSLGVDGLCQILGFYLGWSGYRGKGRAVGVGKTQFKKEIVPQSGMLRYQMDVKLVRGGDFPLAIGDGLIICQDEVVTEVSGIRVGLKPEESN
jgi:3-hydroxyacyl-[acyl-carrier protein] dehydratase/trans-2-decenoyl-[acyl-carrier protein] isomerase